MYQIIEEYRDFTIEIKKLINKSQYKIGYFINELEMSRPTFYRKLKKNTFSVDEVEKIAKILFPKEAYLTEIKASIKRGREDVKNGKITANELYLKQLQKEYL